MKRLVLRKILPSFLLMVIVAVFCPVTPVQAAGYPLSTNDTRIQAVLDFIRNSESTHPSLWGGGEKTCYAIVAISACGADPNEFRKTSGESMVDIIKSQVGQYLKPQASASLAHEYYILAIIAAGENPWNFGGVNAAGQLLDMFDGTQIGQPGIINDDFWAIIALTAAGVKSTSPVIQTAKQFIIAHQNADGGWGCNTDGSGMGSGADPCDTANAIMALIAAGESASSTAILNGLSYLHSKQNDDGGFPYYEGATASDVASDARVMAAIRACGGNPTGAEWTKNGNNPLINALSLQNDDGGFAWTAGGPTDAWMTTYIMPPLVGKYWPTKKTSESTGPVIGNVTPAKDSVIDSTRPNISATYTDAVSGVAVNSIILKIGTKDVTSQAQITESGLTYTPVEDLKEGKHQVQITVTDRVGNKTVHKWSFTVDTGFSRDTTPPEALSISPAQDVTVTTLKPEITADYSDDLSGIDTSSIKLSVNGTDVTSSATVEATYIRYVPAQEMSEGKVTVRLALRDKAGNTAYCTWEFTIKSSGNSDTSSGDDDDDEETGEDTGTHTDNTGQSSTLNLAGNITGDGIIISTATLSSPDGKLTLVLDEEVTALDENADPLDTLTVEPCVAPPALPEDILPVGLTYQVGPDGAVFTPSIRLELGYDELAVNFDITVWDVNCDGSVDAFDILQIQDPAWSGRTSEDFVIAGYDAGSGEWLRLAGSVDLKEKSIFVATGYMTYFTLACPVAASPATEGQGIVASSDLSGKIDPSGVVTSDVVLQSPDTEKQLEIRQGTAVTGRDGASVSGITLTSKDTAPQLNAGSCRIGTACELGPDGTTFSSPIILTFTYEESSNQESIRWDTNGDGAIDFLDKDIIVAPEDFRIAYYDTAAATWVLLDSTVDRVNKTVTAEISHFTLFALVAPVTEPLVINEVAIDSDAVNLGEDITITVTVENPGEHKGTYILPLKIDGVLEDSQEVTLAPGKHKITFSHREPYTGTHEVSILGTTSVFTVNATASGQGNWWDSIDVVFYLYIVIGLLCVVVIAGVIILARVLRRRANR